MPSENPSAPTAESQIATFISGESLDGIAVDSPKPRSHHAQPKADAAAAPAGDEPDESEDEDDSANTTPENKHRSAQDRINKAVGKQRAAEREASEKDRSIAALTARLDALEKGTPPAKQPDLTETTTMPRVNPDKEPDPADFTYGELDPKYTAAVARYETRKVLRESQEADLQTKNDQARKDAVASIEARVAKIAKIGAEKYDDFQDIVAAADAGKWPLSPVVGELILESPFGYEVAYKLGKDIDLAKEVYAMSPARQAVWFGKQEALFETQNPSQTPDDDPSAQQSKGRSVSQAPAPLRHQARGSAGQETVTADTADFAKFERMAMEQQKRR